jgi:RNA polymerase sigma-70 factor, ECF subfamily
MGEITELLRQWGAGDARAAEELFPLVYRELRQTAGAMMRHENPEHTLQPTALVNEAYLRLRGQRREFLSRQHFCGVAGQLMRRVLVDHAREHLALKRGEGRETVSLEMLRGVGIEVPGGAMASVDVLDLNAAIEKLESELPEHARVVEYRFFGGLTNEETAAVMGMSVPTVVRYWTFARVWLHKELVGA